MFSNSPAATWPWPPEEPISLEHDLANRLLEQRVLILSGRLDDAAANRVTSQLVLLSRHDDNPIELHLSCPEAELDPSIALADALDLVEAPVNALVRGTLRGAAVAVLCAVPRRAAHRHAAIVLSTPTATAEGNAEQLAGLAREHERQVGRLRDRIADSTGRRPEDVERDLRAGHVLSAQEALEYGLLTSLL